MLEACWPFLPYRYPTVTAIRKAALCKGCPCTAALASGLPHPYSTLCSLFYKPGNHPISNVALSLEPKEQVGQVPLPNVGKHPWELIVLQGDRALPHV